MELECRLKWHDITDQGICFKCGFNPKEDKERKKQKTLLELGSLTEVNK